MTAAPGGPGRSLIVEFLREHDAACDACGYALRGAPQPRCPECGAEVQLAIRATRGPWWWAFATTGAAVTVGLTAAPLVALISRIVHHHASGGAALAAVGVEPPLRIRWVPALGAAALVVGSGALLAFAATSRRRFAAWPASHRALVGLGCGMSPLLVLVLLRLYAAVTG